MMRNATILPVLALMLAGCSMTNSQYLTEDRLDRGLVIILPGIEGEGPLSYGVRSGLLKAGMRRALPIFPWGRPVPGLGPLLNQMDVLGNRLAAERVADMIVNYQDSHPNRPVHMIGHSGGGGVAVFAAEALPPGRQVDGIVLLSASISRGYDLSKALAHSRGGIANFYSRHDVGLLGVGTTVFGNVDGVRGPSAGLSGFDKSFTHLYQVPWSEEMAEVGNMGGHGDSCDSRFIKAYVADWVQSSSWPAR